MNWKIIAGEFTLIVKDIECPRQIGVDYDWNLKSNYCEYARPGFSIK